MTTGTKTKNGDKQQRNTLSPSKSRTRGLRPRWKPGESGNPKGRPPKDVCLTSLLIEKLEQTVEGDTKTHAQKVVDELIVAVGDSKARGYAQLIRDVFDRVDGPVPLRMQGNLAITTSAQFRAELMETAGE